MQVRPSQITPGESFDIFYFLRNHTDSTTYYIQAKVYDVRTGEVLITVNLAQSSTNSRLFSVKTQAPTDSTGYGRNIVAIATVYTDSGYTTKSTDYEEQEQYFLIKAESPVLGGGGVDYRALKEMMDESVSSHLANLPKLQPIPDMPFEALFGAIGALQREINRVPKALPDDQPDPLFVVLDELKQQLATLQKQVAVIPVPDRTDLSPVTRLLDQVLAAVAGLKKELRDTASALSEDKQHVVADLLTRLETVLTRQPIRSLVKGEVPASMLEHILRDDTPKPDVRHLMKL